MKTTLPEWIDVSHKHEMGLPLNPIERFILDNEPSGREHEDKFRSGLVEALNFAADGEVNGR